MYLCTHLYDIPNIAVNKRYDYNILVSRINIKTFLMFDNRVVTYPRYSYKNINNYSIM